MKVCSTLLCLSSLGFQVILRNWHCLILCVCIQCAMQHFLKVIKKTKGECKLPFMILTKIRHNCLLADRAPRSPRRSWEYGPYLERLWTTAGSWGLPVGVRHQLRSPWQPHEKFFKREESASLYHQEHKNEKLVIFMFLTASLFPPSPNSQSKNSSPLTAGSDNKRMMWCILSFHKWQMFPVLMTCRLWRCCLINTWEMRHLNEWFLFKTDLANF